VYLIRHGEKPSDGSGGLTRKGRLRAQCLRRLFGPNSKYQIDYIIAPDFSGERHRRAYDTVLPLAKHLGIKIDKHCDHDDVGCAADTAVDTISAKRFDGDVLISWRHSNVDEIAKLIGVRKSKVPVWPPDRFDLIWTIHSNGTFTIEEQDCPRLSYLDDDGNPIDTPPILIQNSETNLLN